MVSYGVCCFYYKDFETEETVHEEVKSLLGKTKQKLKTNKKKVRETAEELWHRINEYIKENHLEVITIESIFDSQFYTGGSYSMKQCVNNYDVSGFRIFYKNIM